jgi:hypothetical protein
MTSPIVAGLAVARCAMIAIFTLVATPLLAITINGESRLTEEQFAKKNGKPVSEVRRPSPRQERSNAGTVARAVA